MAPETLSTASSIGSRTSSRKASDGASQCHYRHVALLDVARDHAGEIDRVLRAAQLGRIADLGLRQIVDCRSHLDGDGERADAFVGSRPVMAQGLAAKHLAVGLAEKQLETDHLGTGIVARVAVGIEVDLLVVGNPEPLERLLARARPGDRAAE